MFKTQNFKTSFSALSLAYILLGLFLLIFPSVSARIICIIVGVAALAVGLIRLVDYFRTHNDAVLLNTGFISGFLFAALGLFFIFKPTLVASVLPFVIGLLICFSGIVKLQSAFDLRRFGYDKWLIALITALVALVLGVLLIVNPFVGATAAIMFIGASLIIDGLTSIITMQTVKRKIGDAFDYFDAD